MRTFLKILVLVTMTLDHVGAVFYPEYIWMRWVGRLAFPAVVILLVYGFERTKNIRGYILRLFLFAVIAQVPYAMAFGKGIFEQFNVLFTLWLGLLFLYYFEVGSALCWIPMLASFVCPLDYQYVGVLAVGVCYLFFLMFYKYKKSGHVPVTSRPSLKYLFYAYYPVHLFFIGLLSSWASGFSFI